MAILEALSPHSAEIFDSQPINLLYILEKLCQTRITTDF